MTHTYVSCGRVTIYQRQQIVINKVQLEDGGERAERKRKRERERDREIVPLRFLTGSRDVQIFCEEREIFGMCVIIGRRLFNCWMTTNYIAVAIEFQRSILSIGSSFLSTSYISHWLRWICVFLMRMLQLQNVFCNYSQMREKERDWITPLWSVITALKD